MKEFCSTTAGIPIESQLPHHFDSPDHTARQFVLFKQLPYELQIYIWKCSIPDSQILRLKIEADESLNDREVFSRTDFDWETDKKKSLNNLKFSTPFSKAPGLLAACRDSRAAILSAYTGKLKSKGDTIIRFNPENDTIFLIPIGKGNLSCQCPNETNPTASESFHSHRKPMFLGFGTPEVPVQQTVQFRDYSAIFGSIKKLIVVWSEFFCVHTTDITWTLSNFTSLKELTLVTAVRRDAYCRAYLKAVGSPTIWSVEQISSHFASAQWLVQGLRNDMMTLDRFRRMLESRKSLYYRDAWQVPQIIRFGGCFTDWVEGRE
ncbi:hypothetical protein K3495_g8426 [Podosphaera aphanis]|nr:hypothetical protein K3495_g8426 [Podosphaera aphanis]